MSENKKKEKIADNNEDTTPLNRDEIKIPIKFNKETKEISLDEAVALAQKGMKFDLISDDFNTLKLLSQRNKKSVPEFLEDLKTKDYNNRVNELLEKCGGDEALARHIIDLENSGTHEALNGFCELQSFFKDIKTPDDLPIEVREAAELKGRLLLDEYLRYLLNQKRKKEAFIKANIFSKESSIGSQQSRKDNITPEATEFLRGLWK